MLRPTDLCRFMNSRDVDPSVASWAQTRPSWVTTSPAISQCRTSETVE